MVWHGVRGAIALAALTVPVISLLPGYATSTKSNLTIYNESSFSIRELYVSESSRTTWDNNVLGSDTLNRGETVRVQFGDPSPSRCLYDIRAVFSNGQVLEDYDVNVCNEDEYTFYNQE